MGRLVLWVDIAIFLLQFAETQDKFNYSLDIEPNIISLCSHCHNMIHYGLNQSEIIESIYLKRKNALLLCGIDVDKDELFSFYTNL